jgi:hypothetical protein
MEISQAVDLALKSINKEEFKKEDIASAIKSYEDFKEITLEKIENRVGSYLNSHSKGKEPIFVKVLNKKTSKPSKGLYKLKRKSFVPIVRTDPKPPKDKIDNVSKETNPPFDNQPTLFSLSNKLYFGKAGEFSVVGELLFNGYNASIMSVDEGIDITASKNDRFFFIQVKTTTFNQGTISVSIKRNKFIENSSADVYFIIVFRYIYKKVNTNRYIVIPNKLLEHFVYSGTISKKDDGGATIKIKQKEGHLYLYNGSKEEQIDHWLDNFDLIR